MKKHFILFILILAAVMISVFAAAETADQLPDWTVMFYMCGSDLESRHGYVTGNLEEISSCLTYDYIYHVEHRNESIEPLPVKTEVNVVIETGGSKEWHTSEKLVMDISSECLQRWCFHPYDSDETKDFSEYGFQLVGEEPLASMSDPETLTDFIRWTAENYPAKKYALVLWGHGGGSKTGILIDELFDGDVMYLDELHGALEAGGIHFETILFDACLMANLETACAIQDYANWMVASEEEVAGKGTAMWRWLQQLYCTPQWDGRRLGRWICESTLAKYAEEGDAHSQAVLTWSLIDLSHIGRLEKLFDRIFELLGKIYMTDMYKLSDYINRLTSGTEFGLGRNNMYDLAGIFFQPTISGTMDRTLYAEIMEAIGDVITYNVHGSARSGALGLSFCYAANFSAAELEIYARNCPSDHYLALLDAITSKWQAPDRVYENVDRLTEIRRMDEYIITVEKRINSRGIPGLIMHSGESVYADLYYLNEKTGHVVRMGSTSCSTNYLGDEDDQLIYTIDNLWQWPTIEDVHCEAVMVDMKYHGRALYNIPVRIGTDTSLLRCGYNEYSDEPYRIYGLWEGYDADNGVYNRNVIPLAQLTGQELSLLFPLEETVYSGNVLYEASEAMPIFRSLEMGTKQLPAGTYYIDYWAEDIFYRWRFVDRVEIHWDGETATLPEDINWSGTKRLLVPEG
ncbi:MAG: hypothetical protein IJ242_12740 [Clostridia bacterium]|nr:hypothetical protein [Clostridia bacterium]